MGQSRRAFFKFLSLRSTVLSLSHQVRAMMNGNGRQLNEFTAKLLKKL
jgi:hypothetical protein